MFRMDGVMDHTDTGNKTPGQSYKDLGILSGMGVMSNAGADGPVKADEDLREGDRFYPG